MKDTARLFKSGCAAKWKKTMLKFSEIGYLSAQDDHGAVFRKNFIGWDWMGLLQVLGVII